MRLLKLDTGLRLPTLQQAFAATPPAGLQEFWLEQAGQFAQVESPGHGLMALQYTESGLKLSQHRGAEAEFMTMCQWLRAQQIAAGESLPADDRPHVLQSLPNGADADAADDAEESDADADESAPATAPILKTAGDFYTDPEFLARGWQAFFPQATALNFEIGCGYGHFLAWLAPRHRQQAFIGVDIVSKILRKAEKRLRRIDKGAANVLLAKLDALLSLEELIARASLDHLYILFPDPWPKSLMRRSLRADTLPLFASRLKAGGRLIFVSDDPDYSRDARELLDASPLFEAAEFPPIEVKTKYEQKWLAQAKTITRLAYRRVQRDDLPDTGSWPGYALQPAHSLPDWQPERLERIRANFALKVFKHRNLSFKLDACYSASRSRALRFRLILAPGGSSLAQHSWLSLDAQGSLQAAPGSWLPCLNQREMILAEIAGYLSALSA